MDHFQDRNLKIKVKNSLIRFNRKVYWVVLHFKPFYKYSLFALLLIHIAISFGFGYEYFSEHHKRVSVILDCSLLMALRELMSCYLHRKCAWQITACLGLITYGCINLIFTEYSDFYQTIISRISTTIFGILTIILMHKATDYDKPIF